MKLELPMPGARMVLAAGLLFGVAAAHAAGGYAVTRSQEALIIPGMSIAEVQTTLGRPAQQMKIAIEPGPTFTYNVIGSSDTVFDVDFGADGKVLAVSERVAESS